MYSKIGRTHPTSFSDFLLCYEFFFAIVILISSLIPLRRLSLRYDFILALIIWFLDACFKFCALVFFPIFLLALYFLKIFISPAVLGILATRSIILDLLADDGWGEHSLLFFLSTFLGLLSVLEILLLVDLFLIVLLLL